MTQEDIDKSEAPLIDHLIELRQRLIYCVIGVVIAFVAAFAFAGQIFNVLVQPFFWALGQNYDLELIYTTLPEKFFTEIKIGVFGALFITFPLIAIQIYRFVAPGLYRNEKDAFRPYLLATPAVLHPGRGDRVFPAHAGRHQVLHRLPAEWCRRPGRDQASAQGERISELHHGAHPGVWCLLSASCHIDASRARSES